MTRSERQIRVLLHAWPVSDRVERGDEVVGTSLDLVPEGRTWIPLSMAVNLLAGGLRARWRRRPPMWWWLYYRAGGRLPVKWRAWVFHDLTDPGWLRRIVAGRLAVMLVNIAISISILWPSIHASQINHPAVRPVWWDPFLGTAIVVATLVTGVIVLVTCRTGTKIRDRQLGRHGFFWPARNDPPWPPPPPQSTAAT